jgi:quercetin dioxygenase-like cupin family protein
VDVVRLRGAAGDAVARFSSAGARTALLAELADGGVAAVTLEPNGRLGRHPAAATQLLVLVRGRGTAAGADRVPVPLEAGDAVIVAAGEDHELWSEGGLEAVVVEARSLACRPPVTPAD